MNRNQSTRELAHKGFYWALTHRIWRCVVNFVQCSITIYFIFYINIITVSFSIEEWRWWMAEPLSWIHCERPPFQTVYISIMVAGDCSTLNITSNAICNSESTYWIYKYTLEWILTMWDSSFTNQSFRRKSNVCLFACKSCVTCVRDMKLLSFTKL